MEKLFIPIILGTSRPGRESEKVAKFVLSIAEEIEGAEFQLIDPTQFKLPADGNQIRDIKYSDITARADGFIIVTPEYNHSYPGSLKRLLDSEFENYRDKPVILMGVSDGPWGGTRAIEALLSPLKAMNFIVLNQDVNFPKVPELFNEDGSIKDEEYIPRVKKRIEKLLSISRILKEGKSN